MNFDNFRKDDKTIGAVVRNFEIIGEAANRISEKVKTEYKNIDFGKGVQGCAPFLSLPLTIVVCFPLFFLKKKWSKKVKAAIIAQRMRPCPRTATVIIQ